MKDKLISLLKNSYSPYSKFAVAAILVTKDNKEFYGVNFENASYGSTICAERNAIGSAITAGYKKGDFKELYLMLSSGNFGTPCCACRQVLIEFMNKSDKVISINDKGEEKVYTVEELCPYPFSDEDLQ
ncbi:MAG: cytidine deaminase [Bacilli bacterium]|nr:cytidine deaminase [Bacilli bacterium]